MANLKHKKCGGHLHINVAGLFSFKSPSLGVSLEGVSIGPLELQEKPDGKFMFSCSKCEADVETTSTGEISVECSVCRKYQSCDVVFTSNFIPSICQNCIDMLSGKRAPSEEIRRVSEYIYLPKFDEIKFVPFSEILSKKISL